MPGAVTIDVRNRLFNARNRLHAYLERKVFTTPIVIGRIDEPRKHGIPCQIGSTPSRRIAVDSHARLSKRA